MFFYSPYLVIYIVRVEREILRTEDEHLTPTSGHFSHGSSDEDRLEITLRDVDVGESFAVH